MTVEKVWQSVDSHIVPFGSSRGRPRKKKKEKKTSESINWWTRLVQSGEMNGLCLVGYDDSDHQRDARCVTTV